MRVLVTLGFVAGEDLSVLSGSVSLSRNAGEDADTTPSPQMSVD